MRNVPLTILIVIVMAAALPAAAAGKDNLFWGGGIGLGFGTVDYVDVSPMLGIRLTDEFSTGIQLTFQYRKDGRYNPSLSTTDYGGRLFARYDLFEMPIFVQAEYEVLSFEYLSFDGSTDRDSYDSILAGGGYYQPMGG